MAKGSERKPSISENYLSLGLGILVVVVIGALIFNYVRGRSTQPGETTLTAEEQEAEEQARGVVPLPTVHKVVEGEDLWKISERYYKTGYNWTDIAKENNLANPSILSAGMELTIPNVEPKILSATGELAKTDEAKAITSPEAITGGTYTVAHGDSLWKIAVRAYGDGFKWVEIAKANELVNPDVIHAGNVFEIPR